MRILGIETSCDETAVAVYDSELGVLSNVLFSQIPLHSAFGGVVPEIASRSHIEQIHHVVREALARANCSLSSLDAIAVTNRPGLPGSLLVGVGFAKAIAFASALPLVGVNHLEGHIYSSHIEQDLPFPYVCLTASGGHTALYYVEDFTHYKLLGETTDDAAGEAFDKIAKLLGLPYPGGPRIEQLAREGEFRDYFSYPRLKKQDANFSFSGLKTAVLYDLIKRGAYDPETKSLTTDDHDLKVKVASSLLVCIKDIFLNRLTYVYNQVPVRALSFVGGVACNAYLKDALRAFASDRNSIFATPSPAYCTDNGAMIAFAGYQRAQRGEFSDLTLDIGTR